MNKKSLWIAICAVSLAAQVWASSLETLEAFLKSTQSARSEFTQIVTTPPKPGQAARVKKSTGTFAFLRPSRFRFDYQKPFAQTIVADGQTLWLYDADLEQVTARTQSQALGSTPAALIATAANLASLEKDFVLQALPDADGLQWVLASPKNREGSLQSVRIGLKQEDTHVGLSKLEILDALGQNSVLSFDRFSVNPAGLGAATFSFVPPKGVDVIRP
jgi:outer membrane lipoprotein carrier protein